jgi:hypothetical protein
LIVDHCEVVALQILDVAAVAVGDGEDDVNFVDCLFECRDGLRTPNYRALWEFG